MRLVSCFIIGLLAYLFSINTVAKAKIRVSHDINTQQLARVKVHNETNERLLCYVAIDGHKVHFRLAPRGSSIWYKATDTRFNYKDFSTWCDYLKHYPQHQN